MLTVTIHDLRRRLQEYLCLAEMGQSLAIVREGITVAELRPPQDQAARTGIEQTQTVQGGLHEASSPYYPLPQAHQHLSAQEQSEGWEERGVREGWLRLPTIDERKPPPRIP